MDKNRKKLIADLIRKERKIKKRKRNCLFKNCSNQSINTHSLQENGILNLVAEDRHVIKLTVDCFSGNPSFMKVGLNKALSFKGLCEYHDFNLFKEIENKDFDPFEYKNQLLLSYRSILYEMNKKIVNFELHSEFKTIVSNLSGVQKSIIEQLQLGYQFSINDLDQYKNDMEESIVNDIEDLYHFETLQIDYLPVCISSIFDFYSDEEIEEKKIAYLEVPNNLILNIFPKSGKTYIIIGYHTKFGNEDNLKFLQLLRTFSPSLLNKKVSDFMLLNTETWVCNPSFYGKFIKHNEETILDLIKTNLFLSGIKQKTDVNLFSKYNQIR